MFRLATVKDWWDATADPRLAALRATPPVAVAYGPALLKCIGLAFVAKMFKTYGPKRALEFGHGDLSPLFDWFGDTCEMWGIEDAGPYYSPAQLEEFRSRHSRQYGATFINGHLGKQATEIPDSHFDLICSVSVVEHIPYENIPEVIKKISDALRPGGVSVNSYDICYDQPEALISRLFQAHKSAGLTWVAPNASPELDWDPRTVCFEDPRTVFNWYMHHVEDQAKVAQWPGNFATVLIAARKA